MTGSQNRESFTPGQMRALQSGTQGGSRMPELGPYGSVRGARGNSRPYREPRSFSEVGGRIREVRSTPDSRHRQAAPACPKSANRLHCQRRVETKEAATTEAAYFLSLIHI